MVVGLFGNSQEEQMQKSRVLKKLRAGKPVLCTKLNYRDPAIIEMVGLIGFDCVWICQEHLWANKETLANLILAARATGMDAMVRIEKNGYNSLIQSLEMGAKGIMVPHIFSVKEAKKWIKIARFHPVGRRPIDGVNADADWALMDFKDYIKFANEETFLVLQIEDKEAIEYIEEIVQLPGFDILFVGVGDLSQSMGFPGEIKHPKIIKVLERVSNAAKKYGKFAGAPGISLDWTKKLMEMGYLFITQGADIIFLKDCFQKLRKDYESIGFSFENK